MLGRCAVGASEICDLIEGIGLIDAKCIIGTDTSIALQREGGDRLSFAGETIVKGELGVDDVGVEREGTPLGLEIGHDDGAVERIDEIDGVGIDVEVEPAGRGVALHPERPGIKAAVEGPGRGWLQAEAPDALRPPPRAEKRPQVRRRRAHPTRSRASSLAPLQAPASSRAQNRRGQAAARAFEPERPIFLGPCGGIATVGTPGLRITHRGRGASAPPSFASRTAAGRCRAS